MRTCTSSIIFVFTALAFTTFTGCGSTTPAVPAEGAGAESRLPVDAEVEGLAWGTPRAELEARHHDAKEGADGGLAWPGAYAGREAQVVAYFEDGLQAIRVDFDAPYPSMDACGVDWAAARAELDGRFGASQSDNLAAYWQNDTREVELACDPEGDEGVARMRLTIGRPSPE